MAKKNSPKPPVKTVEKTVAAKAEKAQPRRARQKMPLQTVLCLILAAIAIVVYANTLMNEFALDDSVVTTKNTIVKQGFKGIPEILVTPRTKGVGFNKSDNYRPLTLTMFAVEYQLFGESPAIFHLFNILFFAAGVVLLFLFLDKLFDRRMTTVAFIAALLFAVHPIHTEVVANIKSRDEIMCFFFGFLSLNVFMEYMRQGKVWLLLAGTLCLFLGFLSKETVITFLAIVPLVFFFYQKGNMNRAALITAGTVLAAAVFIAIRTAILNKYDCNTTIYQFIDNPLVGAPFAKRMATAFVMLGMYLRLLVVPYPLNDDYCYNSVPLVNLGNIWALLSLAAYCAMAVIAVIRFIKNQKDPWAFGIVFYLATLALFSNVPFLIGAAMGERFVFFPSVGFCLAAALAIDRWILKSHVSVADLYKSKAAMTLLLPVCLLFSGLTIARNSDWKNNMTLFSADLAKSPQDARLNFYMGDELVETAYAAATDTNQKKQIIAQSIPYLNKAVAIYPDYSDAHTELGKAYFLAHGYDSAIAHFIDAMIENPFQYITASNLYAACTNAGKYTDAIGAYKQVIKLNADYIDAYYYLGASLVQVHQYDSAIYYFNKTLALNPQYPGAEMQIGVMYSQQLRFDLAEPHFVKAMQQNPNDVNAVNDVGVVYLNTNRVPQAIEMFKKAVAMNPKYVDGYSKMGRAYYQLKQYQQTIDALNQAIALDNTDVKDVPYIALSYKALGKMDMAKQYEAIAQRFYHDFKL